jgi:PncC family amidohydrolase
MCINKEKDFIFLFSACLLKLLMSPDIRKTVEKVNKIFRDRRLTLSVAESCTGGLISHYLTSIPGASEFFKAAIVSYSEDVKSMVLGVSADTILRHGVVSEETAREMAEKVRLLMKTDYSVSTTGNLGPDVLEGKERGLVFIVVCDGKTTSSRRLKLEGDRQSNKEQAALSALKLLLEMVEDKSG